ncbi:TBC1 domain family member 15 [Porphyridium purpureum]|uniref:TBC1 domain family member 15 n=1 Tax=Porphyridium purpureum TaxID=35688 RepID=A0A5J4Z4X3_PORPP|nr:TBC1 domain family member 15 [Porphyridium purpureum]|eukprot:POR5389..scf295_1
MRQCSMNGESAKAVGPGAHATGSGWSRAAQQGATRVPLKVLCEVAENVFCVQRHDGGVESIASGTFQVALVQSGALEQTGSSANDTGSSSSGGAGVLAAYFQRVRTHAILRWVPERCVDAMDRSACTCGAAEHVIQQAFADDILTIRRSSSPDMIRFALAGSRIFLELRVGGGHHVLDLIINTLAPKYVELKQAKEDPGLWYAERLQVSLLNLSTFLLDWVDMSTSALQNDEPSTSSRLSNIPASIGESGSGYVSGSDFDSVDGSGCNHDTDGDEPDTEIRTRRKVEEQHRDIDHGASAVSFSSMPGVKGCVSDEVGRENMGHNLQVIETHDRNEHRQNVQKAQPQSFVEIVEPPRALSIERSLTSALTDSLTRSWFATTLQHQASRVERALTRTQLELTYALEEIDRNPSALFNLKRLTREDLLELEDMRKEEEEERNTHAAKSSSAENGLPGCASPSKIIHEKARSRSRSSVKYHCICGRCNQEHSSVGDESEKHPPVLCISKRGVAVTDEAWVSSCWTSSGQLVDPTAMRYAVFCGGLRDAAVRKRAWPLLLNVFDWSSSTSEREEKLVLLRMTYFSLVNHWRRVFADVSEAEDGSSPNLCNFKIKQPGFQIDIEKCADFEDDDDDDNYHPASGSVRQGSIGTSDDRMKEAGPMMSQEQLDALFENRLRVENDVVRTDRHLELFEGSNNPRMSMMVRILMTYALRNMSVGYAQGMSDLLAVILWVFADEEGPGKSATGAASLHLPWRRGDIEVMSFWCFAGLMERFESNFRDDQVGIHTQLNQIAQVMQAADGELFNFFQVCDPQFHCCFRWMLVQFKRELDIQDLARLWEVQWIDWICPGNLHIYVAVAILIAHRSQILSLPCKFDAVLRFVNSLSHGAIVVDDSIDDAIRLHARVGDKHVVQSESDANPFHTPRLSKRPNSARAQHGNDTLASDETSGDETVGTSLVGELGNLFSAGSSFLNSFLFADDEHPTTSETSTALR